MIKITDTAAQYQALEVPLNKVIESVMIGGQYIGGHVVEHFRKSWASYNGVDPENVVTCNSGTDALVLALRALLKEPAYIGVPGMSFLATAEAAMIADKDHTLFYFDIEEGSEGLLDLDNLEKHLERGTFVLDALIVVHLHGYPLDMDRVMALGFKYGFFVIEDCAQAHGLNIKFRDKMKKAGTIGHAGAFSHFPTKNLGAAGDGGSVIFQNERAAAKAAALAAHGTTQKNVQSLLGFNSRLDAIQAAVLSVKLAHLDHWNRLRMGIAQKYNLKFKGIAGFEQLFDLPPVSAGVFHHYILMAKDRNIAQVFRDFMLEAQIECISYYPVALPDQPMAQHFQSKIIDDPCFRAKEYALKNVALPLHPFLEPVQFDYIVSKVKDFVYQWAS